MRYKAFMKNILLASLLIASFNSFAESADYVCGVQHYQVELTLSPDSNTSMWLTDTLPYETISQGFAEFVEKKGSTSTYHFYPAGADEVQLTFKTQDVLDLPETLNGYIETKAHGFLLWDKLPCRRTN